MAHLYDPSTHELKHGTSKRLIVIETSRTPRWVYEHRRGGEVGWRARRTLPSSIV